jgi:hypothetical protein
MSRYDNRMVISANSSLSLPKPPFIAPEHDKSSLLSHEPTMRPDPPFCTENYFPTLKMSAKPIGRGYLLRLNEGRAKLNCALVCVTVRRNQRKRCNHYKPPQTKGAARWKPKLTPVGSLSSRYPRNA